MDMESDDLKDEIRAIQAIYPECIQKLAPLIYRFKLPQHEKVTFKMSFPDTYPMKKPVVLDVVSASEYYHGDKLRQTFDQVLEEIYQKDLVVIFDLFSEVDGKLSDEPEEDVEEVTDKMKEVSIENNAEYTYNEQREISHAKTNKSPAAEPESTDPLEGWSVSDIIKDRKSTFIGFAREVYSVEEVDRWVNNLLYDRKVAKANHVMRAYRIKEDNSNVIYEDCDDDGEAASGSRLLHLLEIMDAWNAVVVVVRWFGGTHLGPVRFRHINECARDALVKGALVKRNDKKRKGN
ncbi:hypothetical protein FOA43_001916 [Brettanomyces nanus]|uniref:RWD domain-containing protein n=1 Tax=Eeniella nana TaxID=13502 RepID=A0A875S2L5_EENNA|nr:uncharacterized protein FOA43_001916 [Brettanomyces nanus]QPG74585.1 hypothetical protein FOA43_001916 [Brettanomyces nanus]